MPNTTRRLAAGPTLAAVIILGSAATGYATDRLQHASHVRSSSAFLMALIARATEQSPTFRALVAEIDTRDGIVYVEEGRCRYSFACLVGVTEAGKHRMLWVMVDTRRGDLNLMASIGHELQHPIEILSNPNIRSSPAMFLFFSKIGKRIATAGGTFETKAAVEAGDAVRAEIRGLQSGIGEW